MKTLLPLRAHSFAAADLKWTDRVKLASFVGACWLLVGCQSPPASLPESASSTQAASRLRPGDVLKFTYSGDPNLSQAQKIRQDGTVSLVSIGEVTAGGKRLRSLQEELNQRYKKFLTNSEVLVTLEGNSSGVIVVGQVNKPGQIPLDAPLTLFKAIETAGGFTDVANDRKVVLTRTLNHHHYSETIDLSGIRRGRPVPAVDLRPDDVVTVKESYF